MKPKVLFILHLPPPVHGAAMVGQCIHDSEKICSEFECRFINLTVAQALDDLGRFKPGKIIRFFKLYSTIIKALDSFVPDLVYITPNAKGLAFFKEYVLVQAIKRRGIRLVAHFHNKGVSTKQHNPVYDFMYRRFFKGLKIIMLSSRLVKDIEVYADRKDIFICPNGIPEQLPYRTGCISRSDAPRLLFLSNLLISKGVLVLLDALKILADRGESFSCDFVGGETSEMDSVGFQEEITRRGLNDKVRYRGRQVGADKEAVFQLSDIFIFPTLWEAFGLVLLEAMQHSLPSITTDEGGIPDIIEDGVNGLIVKKGDADDLAEKISILMKDPERCREMGAEGHRRYLACYTIEKFEDNFISVLKKCCTQ